MVQVQVTGFVYGQEFEGRIWQTWMIVVTRSIESLLFKGMRVLVK